MAAALVVGCGKNKPATEAPADAMADGAAEASPEPAEDGGGAWAADDDLVQMQTELEGFEDALLETGVELSSEVAQARTDMGKSSVAAGAGAGGDRCQRRCDLATNICSLSERICALADDHGREARYARVCDRATLDCGRAKEACEGCEG
ncbi:hypothetical protein [Paraliomyxa miuraensis]|uniref:hypothetical protein n=1 Tax=Paraliomyxa miuraensis TaxID=376150 RepID=UPI002259BB45|nr:hypothetical protein [Paraliomyxa miuraensis]MCX4246766.1 hypothetical protein [Paraliomyxa miuraensis]